MKWWYEELGAEAPFDDADEVIKTKSGASVATSWQHMTARAILAYVRLDAQLRDAFALKLWPQPERKVLTDDIIALINTIQDDPDTVAERIFARIRQNPSVNQQFEEMLTEDEIEQMVDDCQSVILENFDLANAPQAQTV